MSNDDYLINISVMSFGTKLNTQYVWLFLIFRLEKGGSNKNMEKEPISCKVRQGS